MKLTQRLLIVLIFGVTFLTGISFDASAQQSIIRLDDKANFADVWPTIEYETDSTVAVGVHDQRPYVINGEKSPTYAGTVRGWVGNPWNVHTESNKPLSNDIAIAIVSGFMHVGKQAKTVTIPFSDDHQAALEKLKQLGTKKIVIVTLREWRIDIYRSQGFLIDAILRVYDREGNEIAQSAVSHKNIDSGDGTVESIYRAARLYLGMLLNDTKVKAVLASKPSIFANKENIPNKRFIASDNGTVIDKFTGLMWAAKDNGSGITWQEAKKYCESYHGGGYTDWRIPTQGELETLYDSQMEGMNGCSPNKFIELTHCSIWALEPIDSKRAMELIDSNAYFRFDGGTRESTIRHFNSRSFRALPVRSGK
jgi:hypothetical protein